MIGEELTFLPYRDESSVAPARSLVQLGRGAAETDDFAFGVDLSDPAILTASRTGFLPNRMVPGKTRNFFASNADKSSIANQVE